jgi:cell wall-associated NlpC family hydrolase
VRNPGEGYPFDYLQQTTLWIGTPVAIMSTSVDRNWYFVLSPYGLGWVQADRIAHTNPQQRNKIITADKAVILKDDLLIHDHNKTYRLHTGTILPADLKSKEILIPAMSTYRKNMALHSVSFESPFIQHFPVEFNKQNVQTVLGSMLEGKYSWGGLGGGRDCSSTLKDYFAAFGIWVPRNSRQQRYSGKHYDLTDLSKDEKAQTIKTEGLPYLTALYKPGHIVLYLGENANETIQIYHTVWGLKPYFTNSGLANITQSREQYGIYGVRDRDENQVETRLVIGKTVITDIEPDINIRQLENTWVVPFLENMETLTIVPIK